MNVGNGLYNGETSKHRDVLLEFCVGAGLDIGFGGDPIAASSIRMDLQQPYAKTGLATVQLGGDCRDLYWFRNDVLDYVYSSHVLEDFPEHETEAVLREWSRAVRVGGNIVLLLPDQQRYLAYCVNNGYVDSYTGIVGNVHHLMDNFSSAHIRAVAERIGCLRVKALFEELGDYSFGIVLEKTEASEGVDQSIPRLQAELAMALGERDNLLVLQRQYNSAVNAIPRMKEEMIRLNAEVFRLKNEDAWTLIPRLSRRLRSRLWSWIKLETGSTRV